MIVLRVTSQCYSRTRIPQGKIIKKKKLNVINYYNNHSNRSTYSALCSVCSCLVRLQQNINDELSTNVIITYYINKIISCMRTRRNPQQHALNILVRILFDLIFYIYFFFVWYGYHRGRGRITRVGSARRAYESDGDRSNLVYLEHGQSIQVVDSSCGRSSYSVLWFFNYFFISVYICLFSVPHRALR